jgi:NAD-dependent SIR2 family protein deacetylase
MDESLKQAAEAIAAAEALLVAAGAGMGVDSGLPDFRGKEGFWNAYPPYRHLRLSFSQMANPEWFRRDPEFAWGFYGHRLNLYRATTPHAGFGILLKWADRMTAGARVFTSNVDGHFARAGFREEHIAEAHGSIHHLQCGLCGKIWNADGVEIAVDPETFRAQGPLPQCDGCNMLARPNILMFGDDAWLCERAEQQLNLLEQWLEEIRDRRTVIVECGAGTAIPTVRSFSELVAGRENSTLVRINVREPEVPRGHIGLPMGALAALMAIDAHLSGGTDTRREDV